MAMQGGGSAVSLTQSRPSMNIRKALILARANHSGSPHVTGSEHPQQVPSWELFPEQLGFAVINEMHW